MYLSSFQRVLPGLGPSQTRHRSLWSLHKAAAILLYEYLQYRLRKQALDETCSGGHQSSAIRPGSGHGKGDFTCPRYRGRDS